MRAIRVSVGLPVGVGAAVVAAAAAWGQPPPSSAKVDTQPLELTAPDRYSTPSVLEPVRRVTLVATADGIVRSQDARAGADVRPNQEVAQLDKAEALALLKIAQAEAREQQAAVEIARQGGSKPAVAQAQARAEAASARVELAQAAVDRCTLRAPFAGRIMESHVSDGQYVAKGAPIAVLADVSSLRALIPVARAGASVGGSVTLNVEGQTVQGRVQAILPLPESLAPLRELSTPMAAAWVVLPNTTGSLEPGQRVTSPALPTAPIATVPARAVQVPDAKKSAPVVQVIRNEYVANVPVRVLGNPGPDRVQVTGPLRPTDALIVSSSVPLVPGTLIRFHGAPSGAVEGTPPDPSVAGDPAQLSPPPRASSPTQGRPARPAAPAVKKEEKVPF